MTNHPNRGRGPYTAEMGGCDIAAGEICEFPTIRAARAWAETHGHLAHFCSIRDRAGRLVASHRRDQSGDGVHWFAAAV